MQFIFIIHFILQYKHNGRSQKKQSCCPDLTDLADLADLAGLGGYQKAVLAYSTLTLRLLKAYSELTQAMVL